MIATLVFEEQIAALQSAVGSLDLSAGFPGIILRSHCFNPVTVMTS
jgi:hypothetical protein